MENVYAFSFEPIDSKMYIIIENNKAFMVDCVPSEEAEKILRDNDVEEITIILTHEHFDHILGLDTFRKKFNCTCLCSEKCGENIKLSGKNFSRMSEVIFMGKDTDVEVLPFETFADEVFSEDYSFVWEGHKVECIFTPGHSESSICIIFDGKYLFSGDTIVDGYKIITRFPTGSRKKYLKYTLPFIKSLDEEMLVFPGHGNIKKLKEFDLSEG